MCLSSASARAEILKASSRASQPVEGQTFHYDVYAGGIHAVEAELHLDLPPETDPQKTYRLSLAARTRGFLGKLAPWSGMFETRGVRRDLETFLPVEHRSISKWRDETEVKTYTYTGDGRFVDYQIVEGGRNKTPKKIDADLTRDTTDVLSATMQIMQALSAEPVCTGRAEIFDGKRRYALVFRHDGNEELKTSRYNAYSGPAARCVIEVQPLAGKWHSKPRGWMSIQEQGRQNGALPTVWMGQVEPGGPAVPVKIRVKTDYGTMFMHLTTPSEHVPG